MKSFLWDWNVPKLHDGRRISFYFTLGYEIGVAELCQPNEACVLLTASDQYISMELRNYNSGMICVIYADVMYLIRIYWNTLYSSADKS